jgi:hypothetical protein
MWRNLAKPFGKNWKSLPSTIALHYWLLDDELRWSKQWPSWELQHTGFDSVLDDDDDNNNVHTFGEVLWVIFNTFDKVFVAMDANENENK